MSILKRSNIWQQKKPPKNKKPGRQLQIEASGKFSLLSRKHEAGTTESFRAK